MRLTLPFLMVLAGLVTACARPSGGDTAESAAEISTGSSLAAEATAVMAVLDELLVRFNALDIEGWEATFHFPNVRLMAGAMTVIEEAGMQPMEQILDRLKADRWHHSGWISREIVRMDAGKAHVDTVFTRYREDGSEIGTYNSLYILTKEDGRWGVKASSIIGL